uniref:AAA domain-containing protein, putative AbiEii toxin, Type IV TA system n=1 Tax=Candidatus Kentrum sp. TUN TaxID=2126343 RepID=A0A450ZRV9_9GAMM|nr:MAG: AAA domain-containing protein, putative AbiEii toxin, Type IV TA system [Candidatus Kentron sp. TUN]
MKIEIHNFGPIHRFDCDLDKDLHLIVGENNIGKSYAITLVYLLLKSLIESGEDFDWDQFRKRQEVMRKDLFGKVSLTTGEEVDISVSLGNSLTDILEDVFLNKFRNYFGGTYNSIDSVINKSSGEEPQVRLLLDEIEVHIGVAEGVFAVKNLVVRKAIKVIFQEKDKPFRLETDKITIYCDKEDYKNLETRFSVLSAFLYHEVLKEVLSKIRSIHYLPASRSGLYQALSAFGQIVAELSKSRAFLKSRIELPGISIPLSDYFLELSEIDPNRKNPENTPIATIAEEIEENILHGKVEFDGRTKKLFYTPDGMALRLDIDATSSMVSELSPIVAFLRHILTQSVKRQRSISSLPPTTLPEGISPKALIFIEEPEAHLHPENQVKLMSAFADLVNTDVKIIITSHSNYLFNKLNNLILEEKVAIESIQASILKPSAMGSEAIALETDKLGILNENFIGVAEELHEEKVDLIHKMNADA